jgi:hypothetical protein
VEPIRIRTTLYARLSKRAYLRIQIICFALLIAGFIWLSIRPPDLERTRETLALAVMGAATRPPEPYDYTIEIFKAYIFAVQHGRWILVGAMLLGAAETVWMLRRYRIAERQAKDSAAPAASHTTTANPATTTNGAIEASVLDERTPR